jgi:hypothetical protein
LTDFGRSASFCPKRFENAGETAAESAFEGGEAGWGQRNALAATARFPENCFIREDYL